MSEPLLRAGHHWIDLPVVGASYLTRAVKNWSAYQTLSGLWFPSAVDPQESDEPPEGWSGAYEFRYQNLTSACQSFVGDSTDTNTALCGLRYSDNAGKWLNIKAVDANDVQPTRDGSSFSWSELWTNTDLRLDIREGKIIKLLTMSEPGHPLSFEFSLLYPEGWSHEVTGNALVIKDSNGAVQFRTDPVTAWDSTPITPRWLAVALVEVSPLVIGGKAYPRIRIILNAEDCAASVYPIFCDPTSSITSTASVEDTWLNSGADRGGDYTTWNFGGAGNAYAGWDGANKYHALNRVKKAAIPAGTITGLRLKLFVDNTNGTPTIAAYRVKDNTWVEGTSTGGAQTGSSCWNKKVYNTTNWAGSAGCSTSGTDYDADASPPTIPTSGTGYRTLTLIASWASDWRDSLVSDDGVVLIETSESGASKYYGWPSSEGNSQYVPTWEVDYTPASNPAAYMRYYRNRRG